MRIPKVMRKTVVSASLSKTKQKKEKQREEQKTIFIRASSGLTLARTWAISKVPVVSMLAAMTGMPV